MATSGEAPWGEWSLGDLADVARDVAGLLGPSEAVERLTIERPSEEDWPRVHVTVRDEGGTFRLRSALKRCGFETRHIGFPTTREWSVEVSEMVLTVAAGRGPS